MLQKQCLKYRPNTYLLCEACSIWPNALFPAGILLPSSTGPDEYITEPNRALGDTGDYEQSGDLPPFNDDEDFPYGRTDEPARPGGQTADWPNLRTEEAKSSAWGRHGVVILLVLSFACCTDVVW